jgi:acyl-CoA hydrolase
VSTVEIDVEAWVKDDGRGMEQRNIYESAMMVMVMVMVMWDRQATKQAK